MTTLALTALALAALPALVFLNNLRHYRQPPRPSPGGDPAAVSILIPARNEERSVGAAVQAALASRGATLEVVVLDDHSEDRTAAVVCDLAARDARVRLEAAPPLPPGWCGKQHACAVLAGLARYPLLLFVDADVRLEPDGVARLVRFLDTSRADLVSGVPRQVTVTFLERLALPLIHFVLLGLLPMGRMRASRHPAYAAGCGQLFLARREAYARSGGHAAIRASLHDGITLPRAFRRAGLRTDLCDATPVASCRMYRSAREVWHGLAKNATEGLAAPGRILPATILLLGGQVLPFLLLALAPILTPPALAAAALAAGLAYLPRLLGCALYRHSVAGALLHPLGVLTLLTIQWYAAARGLTGHAPRWKGRAVGPP